MDKKNSKLNEPTPGVKHPETDPQVFKNACSMDRDRRVLIARCHVCKYVLSAKELEVKALILPCTNMNCACQKNTYSSKTHTYNACDLCYNMWHALYMNARLKDVNYYRQLDEQQKKEWNDPNRRKRLGLDDNP